MDDKELIAAWRRNAAIAGVIANGTRSFAVGVIKAARKDTLDDAVLAKLRDDCILDLKNTDVSGLPINQEVEFLGEAIEKLEQFLDIAIADARKP